MIIDFDALPEKVIPHFHDGEKEARARAFADGRNRIMLGRLVPGASIGRHVHATNSEIVYILSGTGTAWMDDGTEPLRPGVCHYCPKGHTHGMINDGSEDLVIFTVVPEHGSDADCP